MSRSAGNTAQDTTLRSRARALLISAVDRASGQRATVDVATVVVGAVVAGLLAVGITAAVSAAVPWSQNAAAKQNLGLVSVAQSSADTKYDTFLGGDELVNADMLESVKGVSVRTNSAGDCYVAFVTSPSSATFYSTSKDTTPKPYVEGVTDTSWCADIASLVQAPSSVAPVITLAALPAAQVATDYYKKVTASGLDPMTFSVSSGALPAGLSLNQNTGVISGTPFFEGNTAVSVTATNVKGTSAPKPFTLSVSSAPSLTTVALPDGQVGTPYTSTLNASGYPQSYTFEAVGTLPPGLSLNPATGVISGTPTAEADYTATFTVSNNPDPSVKSAPKAYPLTIGIAPTVITKVLQAATINTAYSDTVEASGHKGPYTFAVASGALPAGLTLNTTSGAVSGTPTVQGSFTVGVTATSSFGTSAVKSISLTVYAVPVITTASLPYGVVGVAYSQTIVATGTNTPTFTVTAGALPAGLTLSSAGALSGTPTTQSTGDNFTVTATNLAGTDARAFTVLVYTVPAVTTASLPFGLTGTAYSQTIVASGYPAPTFTVVAGTLPAGLTLSTAGVLSGTPTTVAAYNFTVRATNLGGFDDKAYTMDIDSDITPIVIVSAVRSTTTGTAYNGAREASTVTVSGAACSGLATTLTITWNPATPAAQPSTTATIAAAVRTGASTSHEVPNVKNGAKGTMDVTAKCSTWDTPITKGNAFNQGIPAPVVTITQTADAETHTVTWTDVTSLAAAFTVDRSVPNAYAPSTMSANTSALTYSSVQANGAVFGYTTTFKVTAALNGYSTSDTTTIANAWPTSPTAASIAYTRTGTVGTANLYASGDITWSISGTCPAGTSRYTRTYDSAEYNSTTGVLDSADKNYSAYALNALSFPWEHAGDVKQGHPYRVGVDTRCDSNLTTSFSTKVLLDSALIYTPQETPGRPVWYGWDYRSNVRGDLNGYATCRGYGGDMCGVKTDSMTIDYTDNCPTGSNPGNTYVKSVDWNGGTYSNTFLAKDGWELPNGINLRTVTYGSATYTCNTRWRTSATSSVSLTVNYNVYR